MHRGLIRFAESGLIPDSVIRRGIGLLNWKRLRLEEAGSAEYRQKKKNDFIEGLKRSPIVLQPEKPREQHYELSPAFFQWVMGNRMKYSCGLWTDSVQTLDAAEEAMLEETCRRAGIADGRAFSMSGAAGEPCLFTLPNASPVAGWWLYPIRCPNEISSKAGAGKGI
jgi:hypothetical protein